jgi:hypothetical protein
MGMGVFMSWPLGRFETVNVCVGEWLGGKECIYPGMEGRKEGRKLEHEHGHGLCRKKNVIDNGLVWIDIVPSEQHDCERHLQIANRTFDKTQAIHRIHTAL